jgi:hypothetical protein
MTVQQLINNLKKLPKNLKVYMSDHDHSEYEISSRVRQAILVDKSLMSLEEIKNHTIGKSETDELNSLPQQYVTLRP